MYNTNSVSGTLTISDVKHDKHHHGHSCHEGCGHSHHAHHKHNHEVKNDKKDHDHSNCATCHNHDISHDHKTAEKLNHLHEKQGHTCNDPVCTIKEPHGHIQIHDELAKSFTKKMKELFPLEKAIENIKSNGLKQFLINVTHLSPAVLVAKLGEALGINSLIGAPASLSSMHLVNRGFKDYKRMANLSIVGVVAAGLQKYLPKWLIRALVGIPIYVMEDSSKIFSHKFASKEFNNVLKTIGKKLLGFEAQITTVPAIIDALLDKFSSQFEAKSGFGKFMLNVAKITAKVLGLSLGFVASSNIVNLFTKKKGDKALSSSSAAAMACPCCGSPGVCVSEVISSGLVH